MSSSWGGTSWLGDAVDMYTRRVVDSSTCPSTVCALTISDIFTPPTRQNSRREQNAGAAEEGLPSSAQLLASGLLGVFLLRVFLLDRKTRTNELSCSHCIRDKAGVRSSCLRRSWRVQAEENNLDEFF